MTSIMKKSLIVLGFALLIAGAFAPTQAHADFGDFLEDIFTPPEVHIFGLNDGGDSNNNINPRNPLRVTCAPTDQSIEVGDSVTWRATATGARGTYTYKWVGTEGLGGTEATVRKEYNTVGYKTAKVVVKSGQQSVTRVCSPSVYVSNDNNNDDDDDDDNDDNDDLRISCYPDESRVEEGETVRWRSSVTGGDGDYDYDWSGDEGLDGDDEDTDIRYDDSGRKYAYLTVRSDDGQRETKTCSSVFVEDDDDDDNDNDDDDNNYYGALGGSCYATPTSANVGESILWGASAWGGDGEYRYTWSGTDSLSGTGRFLNVRYDRPGNKTASVRITSDGKTKVISCDETVYIHGDANYGGNPTTNTSLQVSCSANVANTQVGRQVVWSSTVYGGSGNYSYTWSGTDGVVGYQSSLSTLYDAPGSKIALLTVRSGNQSVTKACAAPVNVAFTPATTGGGGTVGGASTSRNALEVSCYPTEEKAKVGESVAWEASVSGGTGTYRYSWSGADNLRGSQEYVNKKYSNKGTKFAMLTVTSGSQSLAVACDGIVEVGNTGLAALALFGGFSWGFISILLILILIVAIGYLLYNRSKI
jgi:trimeric autotransporter adhesin